MTPTIRYAADPQGIATVWFNQPAKSVNTIARRVLDEFATVLSLPELSAARGVIFASEKPATFIAGADLAELRQLDRASLEDLLIRGQQLFDHVERLGPPTVAAINGHCLGGGFELALACRYRVAADDPAILIGLPEVSLGLIPGWGGTVRLPRLIGLEAAAPLLLQGMKLPPREALRLGIVDLIVPKEALIESSKRMILHPPPNRAGIDREHSAEAVHNLLQETRAAAAEQADACLPAIDRLISVIEVTQRKGPVAGLKAERDADLDLIETTECRSRLDRVLTRRK